MTPVLITTDNHRVHLRQLEFLDALVRERHFGRAAAACHVSQPALSASLQRLEDELGVSLIRRGRRFEGLTREGEELLVWARSALAAIEGLTAEASRLRGHLSGTLRLGAIPTVAANLAGGILPFAQAHRGVRIALTTAPGDVILSAITDRELDGGFVYVDAPLPSATTAVRLYRDRLVLLTTGAQWNRRSKTISWSDAAALPLCLLPPAMQMRQLIDQAFATAGVHCQPQLEADSVAALLEFGLSGGSCIVGSSWLRDRRLPDSARVYQLTPAVCPTVGFVTGAGPLAPPLARLLREALAEARNTADRAEPSASEPPR